MISLEIAENLHGLQRFVDEIDSKLSKDVPNLALVRRLRRYSRSDTLNGSPLPNFKRNYWDSLTTSICTALTPDEIKNAHHFYNQLDELTKLKAAHRGSYDDEWLKSIDALIGEILGRGNPLAS